MLKDESEVISTFMASYKYLDRSEAEIMYQKALGAYLDLAFPFQQNVVDVPSDRPRAYQWIYDCMVEILERDGASTLTGYSENGLSMTWDSSQISDGLRRRVVGRVGVPI